MTEIRGISIFKGCSVDPSRAQFFDSDIYDYKNSKERTRNKLIDKSNAHKNRKKYLE